MLDGVQGACLLEPPPGVGSPFQRAIPIRPPGEKHWNATRFNAARESLIGRELPAALSKRVELLPVAKAKSNLEAGVLDSRSPSGSRFGNCRKRGPRPKSSKAVLHFPKYATAGD